MTGLRSRVVAATAGRDRVLDAIKTTALVLVIVGHSLAWHVTADGRAVNVLELRPGLVVLTWVFQILPLFFAAGAVSNLASLQRHGGAGFLTHRVRRLLAPVLVYCLLWTIALLPFAQVKGVVDAGRFLSQLLWFAAVYLLVVVAVPLTSRWIPRPAAALGGWLAAIAAVDALRVAGHGAIGWLNLLLVWGWLHQVGYYLPRLRRAGPRLLLPGVGLLAAAVGLAFAGPYSTSLITVSGDTELSNLAPPSLVLACFGAGQILILAGLWPALQRLLGRDGLWVPIALVGGRAMGMYLWHIPVVGLAAGLALVTGWQTEPLAPAWWAVHLAVVVIVLPTAWAIAGAVHPLEDRLQRVQPALTWARPAVAGIVAGLAVLDLSATGFATIAGPGPLGLPSSGPILVLVAVAAFLLARRRSAAAGPADA